MLLSGMLLRLDRAVLTNSTSDFLIRLLNRSSSTLKKNENVCVVINCIKSPVDMMCYNFTNYACIKAIHDNLLKVTLYKGCSILYNLHNGRSVLCMSLLTFKQ